MRLKRVTYKLGLMSSNAIHEFPSEDQDARTIDDHNEIFLPTSRESMPPLPNSWGLVNEEEEIVAQSGFDNDEDTLNVDDEEQTKDK